MAMASSDGNCRGFTGDTAEAVDCIERALTSYDIFKVFKSYIQAFDLKFFAVFVAKDEGSRSLDDRVVLTNWESEVIHRCMEHDYYPWSFVRDLRESVLPCSVSLGETIRHGLGTNNDDLERFMFDRGHDVFVHLPTRCSDGRIGAVSFSGVRGAVSITELMNLHFVAEHGFERLMTILGNSKARENPLSNREIECLKAAARGLSVQETSRQIGVTTHTVNYHMANAQKKLDARNKVQSVALAIQRGWLGGF